MEEKLIDVLFIHGGVTFKSREDYVQYLRTKSLSLEKKISWNKAYLENNLPKNTRLVQPRMPLQDDAKYEDWKILFERYLELLSNECVLIGSSLGGIFLAKYLSEQIVSKKLLAVYLVAAPYDDTVIGEDLVGGFELGDDLSKIEQNCARTTLYFSADDDCVPVSHAKKYAEKLPGVTISILDDKCGHFCVSEFPEIVEQIKKDLEK